MRQSDRFSARHGYSLPEREIVIREDAPEEVRAAVLQIAKEIGMQPSALRDIVCLTLRVLPDRNNWSEYPNVWEEVVGLVEDCKWFQVYDIAEAIAHKLGLKYEKAMNEYFRSAGVGWQFNEGCVETRGPEAFETAVREASGVLSGSGRPTAAGEIHEALRDLSQRPKADVTGAIQHAMAALECVARDVSGMPKATLGEILKRKPELLPKPVDEAAEKLWGYVSERGRHLREGRAPQRAEAELVVGVAATLSTYLVTKHDNGRTVKPARRR